MIKVFDDLPNWRFELDEISANVYEVVGTDIYGHKVAAKGLDLDDLIGSCKKKALAIDVYPIDEKCQKP